MVWDADEAAKILNKIENCYVVEPTTKIKELKKTYRYQLGRRPVRKHMAIARERTEGLVAVYINSRSLTGNLFQKTALPGVTVSKEYFPGHQGVDGNKGIASSVYELETLNPKNNHMYLLAVEGPSSFKELLNWYLGLKDFEERHTELDSATREFSPSVELQKVVTESDQTLNNYKIVDDKSSLEEGAILDDGELIADQGDPPHSIRLLEVAKMIDDECSNLEGKDIDAVAKRRVGQGVFRDRLLERFDGACCITGLSNLRLLIASHIVPWSKSTPTQKLDPDNGLLLSVSMDALFDKGLISFSNTGSILISNDLDTHATGILGLRSDFALPPELLTDKRKSNLAIHRELHGFVRSL